MKYLIAVILSAALALVLTVQRTPAPHIKTTEDAGTANKAIGAAEVHAIEHEPTAPENPKETQSQPEQAAKAPEPTPQAVTQAASLPAGCEAYRPLVAQYGWNVDIAMQVMRAESGCNPGATNATDWHETCAGSYGLFQIACMSGVVYDPAQNVAIAWQKYQARGWQPWGVCNSGKVNCY